MATTPVKVGKKWKIQVRVNGVSRSGNFITKAAAQAWAIKTENDIREAKSGVTPDQTFGDLLRKYSEEVSPTKKGSRWEQVRINSFLKDPIAEINLRDLSPTHFKKWRDGRLESVCGSTVVREWNILSNACHHATEEWEWFKACPSTGVKLPTKNPHRDRLITDDEREKLMFVLGYSPDIELVTIKSRIGAAFLFAMETALRAGEIAGLEWQDIHTDDLYLHVRKGKTSAATRDVPLTAEAVRILEQLKLVQDGPIVFQVKAGTLSTSFIKARGEAVVDGLTFHDTRHHAITQLAKKLSVLELARSVGHKDLKQLLVYYNETAAEIAKKL